MILAALLIGALGGGTGWLIGLTLIARDGPRVAHFASLFAGVVGLMVIVAALALPRNHWTFGSEGGGDGFGILGLMLRGAMLCVAALLTVLITEIVRARDVRRQKLEKEAP